MSYKKIKDVINNQDNLNKTSDLATVASAFNNRWSAGLNLEDKDPNESIRSIFLGFSDIITMAKTSKSVALINTSAQTITLGERFIENFFGMLEEAKSNNNIIRTRLLLDLFADGSTVFSNLVGILKLTPAGVALNIVAITVTTISNAMNEMEIEDFVHVDEISEVIFKAMVEASKKITGLYEHISNIIEESVPEDYKFWSSDTLELIGTDGNDDFASLSVYLHDRPRVIFANGGNDTLYGDDNHDMLHGGTGNDTFFGDEGNDILIDTEGFDTYHIKDHDTIYDADGKGQILFNDKALPKEFIKQEGASGVWEAKDSKGNVLYTAIKGANDLSIFSTNSPADRVTLKNFFTTATTSGTTYSALSIVLGDSQEDIDKEGIYTLKTNDKFHSNVYANAFPSNNIQIIGSDKIDWVMANSSNKKFDIDVEGGNDYIFGGDMNDTINGGAGNDIMIGSSGFYDFADENNPKLPKPQKEGEGADEDTLIGGLGNDLISGGFGNDTIWAEDEYKGNSKTPLHEDQNNPYNKNNPDHQAKGDWIVGGRGNDFIHGSTSNDFLQGGADGDHIYGGGGRDVILGDGHIRFGNKTQSIPANININHNPTLIGADIHSLVPGVIGTTPTIQKGDLLSMEYKYDQKANKEVKTRQDFVNVRNSNVFSWDIEIDAKQGDYKLTKQKDIPLADDYHILEDKFHKNTNDFLYGGAGDDLIIGQYGHDYLDGGEGDDILWGDDNRDKDNSKIAGNDTLKGGKGKDTLIGGHGHDRYVFDLADLEKGGYNKTIKDADNQGRIIIDGRDLTGLEFVKIDDVSKVYKTLDDKFELIGNGNGNYTLSGQDFNGVIYIKDTPITDGTILGMVLSAEIKNTAPFSPYGLPNKVILAGENININLSNTFVDAEDSEDKLTYSMTGLGATGLGFDPNTKLLTGTAPDSGIFNLTLSATDTQGLTGKTGFMLGVSPKDPDDPSQWMPITLMNPPLVRPPKHKTETTNFTDKQSMGLMTEETMPTLKQLGLVGEEMVVDFEMKTKEEMAFMMDDKQTTDITAIPDSIIMPTDHLMMDKVGVMGV